MLLLWCSTPLLAFDFFGLFSADDQGDIYCGEVKVEGDNVSINLQKQPTPTPEPEPEPEPLPPTGSELDFGIDGVLQIHTIGNSITNHPEWRNVVYNELEKLGVKTDFVGTLEDKFPRNTESQHDGHSGFSTHDVKRDLGGWLSSIAKPELTIIMIGTNDVAWWIVEKESSIVDRLSDIISAVKSNSPNSTVIVASIPPQGGGDIPPTVKPNARDRDTLVNNYNSGIATLVSGYNDKKIHFVDINSVVNKSDLRDGIHPNEIGHGKMGKAFVERIKTLLPKSGSTPSLPSVGSMKVKGRHLYDSCGEKVILRGANHMTVWVDWDGTPRDGLPTYTEMAKSGANAVRIVWTTEEDTKPAELDRAITNAIKNKMIPMVELHDMTCQWSTAGIQKLTDFWISPEIVSVIKKHERYLLINFGNEIGGNDVSDADFKKEYTSAITQMRNAGIHVPIIIDGTKCGQDIDILQRVGPSLVESDPDKNLMFSVHIWWTDNSRTRIKSEIKESVAMELPLIVGEFASVAVDCTTPIQYKTIMDQSKVNEIGYFPWSWGPQNKCGVHSMSKDNTYENLRSWGSQVLKMHSGSIKKTSVIPYSIQNGSCKV